MALQLSQGFDKLLCLEEIAVEHYQHQIDAALRALLAQHVPVAGLTARLEPGLLAGVRLRAADRLHDYSLRGQLDTLAAELKALS